MADTAGLLTDAIEALTDGFLIYDAEERVVLSNSAIRRYLGGMAVQPGQRAEELFRAYAASLPELADDAEREAYVQRRLAVLRGAAPMVGDHAGAGTWLRSLIRPLPGGGKVVVVSDVSEQKRSEAVLASALDAANRAEDRLTQAVESLAGGFAVYDAEDRLEICNESFRKIMGQVPEAITPGRTLEEGMRAMVAKGLVPASEPDGETWIARCLAFMRARRGTYELSTGRGIVSRMFVRPTPGGGTVVSFADVSELKRQERALEAARDEAREAQERLIQATETLTDAFAIRDAEERLIVCNEAYRQMMQHLPELITPGTALEPGMRLFAERHVKGDAAEKAAWLAERLVSLRTSIPYDVRIARDRFGRGLTLTAKNGDRVSVVADVTELKRREHELEAARDQAEAANRAKSVFLATMSHEIRTPMNGVLGMMEVLERQGLSPEQRESVGVMRDSATALLRIIDDILDFSKIEAGKLDLEMIPFSLGDLIDGLVDTLTVQADAKGLVLVGKVDKQVPGQLIGDPTRLRQILFNLVGNALKFTARGFVRVGAKVEERSADGVRVALTVEDSGIGMDDAAVARLFQPFAQADSSTTRRYGGSGLGLSIVKRLAELMGGDAKAESMPGRGSTFTVTVLLRPTAPGPAEAPDARPAAVPGSRGGRVLVVDDHPVNRKVVARQLELLGVPSDTAADGVEALAKWQAAPYEAVLADLHMPEMDGYELTRRIRAEEIERGGRTPIVAITANALQGEGERCLAAGMDAFLAKPTTLDRLRSTLARWMTVDGAQPPPAAAAAPAFDRGALTVLFGDDRATIDRMLGMFRDSVRSDTAEIESALSRGDLAALAAAAHRIKGASRTIGAGALGDAAQSLEQAGRAADRGRAQRLAGELAELWRRVESEIVAG